MNNQQLILDDVNYRVEWGKYQERIKKQQQEKVEKERVAYAEIDWHDFVIVETVDFQSMGYFISSITSKLVKILIEDIDINCRKLNSLQNGCLFCVRILANFKDTSQK